MFKSPAQIGFFDFPQHLHALVNELLDGEHPIRVWREFRGLTQQQLAERIGITESHLQQLESGIKEVRVRTLSRIASASDVMVDDIACWQTEN